VNCQRSIRCVWLALMAVAALGGCSAPTETSAGSDQTWVAVHGLAPVQETSLEIGDSAFSITPGGGLGVAAAELSSPARVRLVGVADCRVYAEFEAEPGHRYVIRLGPGELEATTEEVEAIELGPGLIERTDGPTDCE
jgi:hypothetical protein